MTSFSQPQLHTIGGNGIPELTGVLHDRVITSAGPTIFATRRTKMVNGTAVEYFSYSILGPSKDQKGNTKSTTFKLGHLLNGGYGSIVIEDGEGNILELSKQEDLDSVARTPTLRGGQPIDGLFQLTGATAKFTPPTEPKPFFLAKTDNSSILTTIIVQAPKVTDDYVDEMMAMVTNGGVLEGQA